ncbi:PRC-barrel domain-containing protein [Allosphingosinicella flava]|uniref:PRC-barrel domain-containing protein n=2 Tax=Allosphingosinicella flava TaxID=2771430 RepID=A0A7T2GLP3_9SPHN|nr:PRC-barrel domain-containing protein [Sphingosinicella flava]
MTLASETEAVTDDTHELISSRRVEGTPVYNIRGERLGHVHSVMIGKKSGQVAYALLSFGGFLGIGEHVHPVPWEILTYDVDLDGYTVDLTREQLKNAPTMRLDESDRPRRPEEDQEISQYYGTMNWWGL